MTNASGSFVLINRYTEWLYFDKLPRDWQDYLRYEAFSDMSAEEAYELWFRGMSLSEYKRLAKIACGIKC